MDEAESGDLGFGPSITRTEVAEVVKMSHAVRATRVDEGWFLSS